MFRLGVHISIAKGLVNSLIEAEGLKCTAMQIFIRNPRGYARKKLADQEIESFKNKRRSININPLVVHGSYLLNLASSDEKLRKKTISLVKEDLKICNVIDADLYVVHFGSNTDKKIGIKFMRESLGEILTGYKGNTVLLLENTAGEGNKLGSNIDQIAKSIKGLGKKVGICLDSAHLFAAGVDIRKKSVLNKFLQEFDSKIGLNKLKLLHLNDSKYGLAEHKDRHQHIGNGFIGRSGFKTFINHPLLCGLPMILETPSEKEKDDIKNLNKVKYLKIK
ncbi:MAG: deoxyribonuclease IV [Candidatus Saelkia tenebricola]|nr:deoxyribonuclease IV [Candidatus Saelkia tenebricola]